MDVIDKVVCCMVRAGNALVEKEWNSFGIYLGIIE